MGPSFSADFVDKLWLSIIDKLALGVAVLVVGYFINRRLESVKSREGVRKMMLERRIDAMLKQWDAVRRYRFDTLDWAGDAWLASSGLPPRRAPKAPPAAMDGAGSPPPGDPDDGSSLVDRAQELTHAIRDQKGLLGKTITDAMYQVVGVHLSLVENARAGHSPPVEEPDSPDFDWLETVLDAADLENLPLLTREDSLAASHDAFLRARRDHRNGSPPDRR